MADKKGFSLLVIIVPVAVVMVFMLAGYFAYKDFLVNNQNQPIGGAQDDRSTSAVVCTQDVKQCPDGSYVARTGPNCEFTQCPSSSLGLCYTGGCSGQVCSDKESIISTCNYKEEYACYKNAKCERQPNRQCGWTNTSVLVQCLSSYAEYVCILPCTGAAPSDNINCRQQQSQEQCNAVKSNEFPFRCEWRKRNYECPPLP